MNINRKKTYLNKETERNYRSFLRKNRAAKKNRLNHKREAVRFKIIRHYINIEKKLVTNLVDKNFFDLKELIDESTADIIISIPEIFCLCSKYEESMKSIISFASGMYKYLGTGITLDFSKCKKADTAALFLMQIVRLEFLDKLNKIQKKLNYINIVPDIQVKTPIHADVIRLLTITGYGFSIKSSDIPKLHSDTDLAPLNMMGFVRGQAAQKHYLENKKPIYTKKIVDYLNSCLEKFDYEFDSTAKNNIEGIISEVLSNAEDHGGKQTWFMTANFSKELAQDKNTTSVGEINLTIMNFGDSMYSAFEKTKDENFKMFGDVENHVNGILMTHKPKFVSREQLFTLALMQEQISRLKYKEESRGTGTMKFITSFLDLGDFIDETKQYYPNLSIFTGKTQLICDNEFKPFRKENLFCLSLNPENDISLLPSESHLKTIRISFPGTLISVKLYLSQDHLDKKYGGNNDENN